MNHEKAHVLALVSQNLGTPNGMARIFATGPNHYSPPFPIPNSNPIFLSRKEQRLALLQSCSSMAELRQIHAQVLASGLLRHDKFLASGLLRFCALNPSAASIKPNYVTFLGILSACSHVGWVDDGCKFFHEMVHVHSIDPMMTHYSAMVDVLGRSGRLCEAYPVKPDAVARRTLLSACHLHGSKDKGSIVEDVKKRLLMLEPR